MTNPRMKRIIASLLSASMVLSTAACGSTGAENTQTGTLDAGTENVQTEAAGTEAESDENDTDEAKESTGSDENASLTEPDNSAAGHDQSFTDLITEFDAADAVDDNYRNYYEIFPGSYYDSDGDGTGDLNGISMKLDYISGLGCTGIWLTPIMQAPSYHKYDTSDYYAVDPSFGTNEDFAALAEKCHEKNIKLIIDLVVNHSSSEHPWFTEACDYLRGLGADEEPDPAECPYVQYYNFSREQVNADYREVTGSDWYYEAVFDYSQPDLNLYNEDVQQEIMNIADFWMDLGVDGFRMDAAMHYDETDAGFNVEFLNSLYEHCLQKDPEFYMVSEVWADVHTIADYYSSGTPSFFNFDVADSEGKLIKAGRGTLGALKFEEACVQYEELFGESNPEYIDAPFITNHDMGRVANALMCDPASLKMTAGMLLTMSGSPFIYYGEEIGMKSKGKKDENKRLHMNWSVSDTEGICKDPSNADKDIVQDLPAADEQIEDADSVFSYYKEALAIRNALPAVARGNTEIVEEMSEDHLAVVKKTWNDETVYILINNGDEQAQISLSELTDGECDVVGLLEADSHDSSIDGTELVLDKKSIAFVRPAQD